MLRLLPLLAPSHEDSLHWCGAIPHDLIGHKTLSARLLPQNLVVREILPLTPKPSIQGGHKRTPSHVIQVQRPSGNGDGQAGIGFSLRQQDRQFWRKPSDHLDFLLQVGTQMSGPGPHRHRQMRRMLYPVPGDLPYDLQSLQALM